MPLASISNTDLEEQAHLVMGTLAGPHSVCMFRKDGNGMTSPVTTRRTSTLCYFFFAIRDGGICIRIQILYPHTGGDNEGPSPWGRVVHSLIHHCCSCHDSSNGFADHDRLATPGSRRTRLAARLKSGSQIAICRAIGRITVSTAAADQ